MDRRDVNRKLKIVEFQSNYSPVAPQYEYSGNIIREKNDVAIANGNKIALVLNHIKNYKMKRAEEKARDLGFETIDNIRYINIK